MAHPSLTEELLLPPPLMPQLEMARNAACWCGSGRKWKVCHRDRERQVPLRTHEFAAELRKSYARGFCAHPDTPAGCAQRIVQAHTVQRRGGLAAIAENGHVYSCRAAHEHAVRNGGPIQPQRAGINSVTTFPGFCATHDADMFRAIEVGTPATNQEAAFLLSFRAIAYEHFAKLCFVKNWDLERELDRGKTFEEQAEWQCMIHDRQAGAQLALENFVTWKGNYDRMFRQRRYADFECIAVTFDAVLPVVASGAFLPEFGFDGQALQRLGNATAQQEMIAYNLTVLNGRTVAVLGWTEESRDVGRDFARSFQKRPDVDKADAAIRLAFEHLENTCIQPSWWDGQSSSVRDEVLRHMQSGLVLTGTSRTATSLNTRRHIFSRAKVEETVIYWEE